MGTLHAIYVRVDPARPNLDRLPWRHNITYDPGCDFVQFGFHEYEAPTELLKEVSRAHGEAIWLPLSEPRRCLLV